MCMKHDDDIPTGCGNTIYDDVHTITLGRDTGPMGPGYIRYWSRQMSFVHHVSPLYSFCDPAFSIRNAFPACRVPKVWESLATRVDGKGVDGPSRLPRMSARPSRIHFRVQGSSARGVAGTDYRARVLPCFQSHSDPPEMYGRCLRSCRESIRCQSGG